MTEISLKEMLEAGVHFGHKRDRWNPKMAPFIFTERNGVHIFDLAQTKLKLEEAMKFLKEVASDGGIVLFVGTKNQVRESIKKAAEKAGMPYLVERWPGGMLTNFSTILKRLKYLKESQERLDSSQGMTKKEQLVLKREIEKLEEVFEGVKDLRRTPDALFVADIVKEKNAVKEAQKLNIPVVGIADSNAEPTIDYIIPGNDDAVRSVSYIAEKISLAIAESKKAASDKAEDEEKVELEIKATSNEDEETLEEIEEKAEEKTLTKKTKIKEDE